MNSNNGNNDALENIIKKSVTRMSVLFFLRFPTKSAQMFPKWLIKRILSKTCVCGTWKVAVDFDAFHFMEDEPIF